MASRDEESDIFTTATPTNESAPSSGVRSIYSYSDTSQDAINYARRFVEVESLALGIYFPNSKSPAQTRANMRQIFLDALAFGNSEARAEGPDKIEPDPSIRKLVKGCLSTFRSNLGDVARKAVKTHYNLSNGTPASIAGVVKSLLKGHSFTDGAPDKNGFPGRWNHPAAHEIITNVLFKTLHKHLEKFGPPFAEHMVAFGHTMVWTILEEWESGVWKCKPLSVLACEKKFNVMLSGIHKCLQKPYSKQVFEEMCREWWELAMVSDIRPKSLDDLEPVTKTYGMDALVELGAPTAGPSGAQNEGSTATEDPENYYSFAIPSNTPPQDVELGGSLMGYFLGASYQFDLPLDNGLDGAMGYDGWLAPDGSESTQ